MDAQIRWASGKEEGLLSLSKGWCGGGLSEGGGEWKKQDRLT